MTTKILTGNALEVLKGLPADSVHMAVTSPPYYLLRAYAGAQDTKWPDGWVGALGAEPSPEAYVSHLCDIFDEVKRVLRPEGSLWINIGDSYAGSGKAGKSKEYQARHTEFGKPSTHTERFGVSGFVPDGCKPKDLIGVPWLLAFEMRRRGWWWRQNVIFAKRSCMPESVKGRCTRSHEYILHFTKSAKYFYDVEATKEDGVYPAGTKAAKGSRERSGTDKVNSRLPEYAVYDGKRNKRDVWNIGPMPWKPKGDTGHYASFPMELPLLCLLAGAPKKVCSICGAPYARIVQRVRGKRYDDGRTCHTTAQRLGKPTVPERGWQSKKVGEAFKATCSCNAPVGVATILDPFAGTGTSGAAAEILGMGAILIDIYGGYAESMYSQRLAFCRKWYLKSKYAKASEPVATKSPRWSF